MVLTLVLVPALQHWRSRSPWAALTKTGARYSYGSRDYIGALLALGSLPPPGTLNKIGSLMGFGAHAIVGFTHHLWHSPRRRFTHFSGHAQALWFSLTYYGTHKRSGFRSPTLVLSADLAALPFLGTLSNGGFHSLFLVLSQLLVHSHTLVRSPLVAHSSTMALALDLVHSLELALSADLVPTHLHWHARRIWFTLDIWHPQRIWLHSRTLALFPALVHSSFMARSSCPVHPLIMALSHPSVFTPRLWRFSQILVFRSQTLGTLYGVGSLVLPGTLNHHWLTTHTSVYSWVVIRVGVVAFNKPPSNATYP
jgi:hypothetical protein